MFVVYRLTFLGHYKAMFVSHGPLIEVAGNESLWLVPDRNPWLTNDD